MPSAGWFTPCSCSLQANRTSSKHRVDFRLAITAPMAPSPQMERTMAVRTTDGPPAPSAAAAQQQSCALRQRARTSDDSYGSRHQPRGNSGLSGSVCHGRNHCECRRWAGPGWVKVKRIGFGVVRRGMLLICMRCSFGSCLARMRAASSWILCGVRGGVNTTVICGAVAMTSCDIVAIGLLFFAAMHHPMVRVPAV